MAAETELPVRVWKYREYKGATIAEVCEIEEIENFQVRDDDVWVNSFARSGTTLTQELSYLIVTGDFEKAKAVPLDDRFPFIDVKDDSFPYYRGVKYMEQQPSPRFIKSHLNYFLLPKDIQNGKGKMIYIARNPKDVCLSFYKWLKYMYCLPKEQTFGEFFDHFMQGDSLAKGSWWFHVKEFWKHKDDPNILFTKFEDVIRDKPAAIRKIAAFLGKSLPDDQVECIAEHCSIENMRDNPAVNLDHHKPMRALDFSYPGFINKGVAGSWKECYTEEMSKRVDDMLEREFGGTGLSFD